MGLLTRAKKILQQEAAPKKQPAQSAPKQEEAKPARETGLAAKIGLSSMLTEKGMRSQEKNTAVFRVRPAATKYQIAAAIREQFGVTTLAVRTSPIRPKTRRRGLIAGTTSAWKKAYVKVADVSKLASTEE